MTSVYNIAVAIFSTAIVIIVHNSSRLIVSWDDHTFEWFGMTRTKDYLARDTLIIAVLVVPCNP